MKMAQALRKQYKIPSEMVVYYVLKIIKGQVPYSGRKWRQRTTPLIPTRFVSVLLDIVLGFFLFLLRQVLLIRSAF